MARPPVNNSKPTLEQILHRGDVWQGHAGTRSQQPVTGSGYQALNAVLLHGGWPNGALIEVCQAANSAEWLLFGPAIRRLCQHSEARIALLNPPALPYAVGLRQENIPLDQLLVIRPQSRQDFITCFVELSQSRACQAVLAWQSGQAPAYSQLRKLQLGAAGQMGLYILFRPLYARQQSSPAGLRLVSRIEREQLTIRIFKQPGQLGSPVDDAGIRLSLPEHWLPCPTHRYLGDTGGEARDLALAGQGGALPAPSNLPGGIMARDRAARPGNILRFRRAGPGRHGRR